jgi:hypothetical protein
LFDEGLLKKGVLVEAMLVKPSKMVVKLLMLKSLTKAMPMYTLMSHDEGQRSHVKMHLS